MTRVGWAFLALVLLALAAFLALTRFGGSWTGALPARAAGAPSAASAAGLLTVPVAGVARGAVADTWGEARGDGRLHHGIDIPAPGGTPVLAAADGVIEKLFASRLGGTTLYQRSRDRRWTYYYAHLAGYAPGLREGRAVRAGETIGYVGDTGDAGPGNFHLHFGLTRTAPDQRWYEGEDVDAYPLLAGRPPGR